MRVSSESSIPIMESVQSTLFRAQCHPIIGTVPAVLKVIVSVVEIVAAGAFLFLLQTVGKPLLSKRFVEHESDACVSHIWLGVMSALFGITAAATLGCIKLGSNGLKRQ